MGCCASTDTADEAKHQHGASIVVQVASPRYRPVNADDWYASQNDSVGAKSTSAHDGAFIKGAADSTVASDAVFVQLYDGDGDGDSPRSDPGGLAPPEDMAAWSTASAEHLAEVKQSTRIPRLSLSTTSSSGRRSRANSRHQSPSHTAHHGHNPAGSASPAPEAATTSASAGKATFGPQRR